jgi:hypothetical protein
VKGVFGNIYDVEKGVEMKRRNKTNRLKAALKRKNVKSSLRKSKGERKYPT